MPEAHFRFYQELNDFLPPERRADCSRSREQSAVAFAHTFKGRNSVKDMIESLGVPHTEIDLILVNGVSVDFTHIVQDGDRISVYPVFETFDITPLVRLRPRPLRDPKFVLDTHLGKLAAYLRMLGFDALYRTDCADDELAHISAGQKRILLTRDRGLLKRRIVTHGYCVRATAPRRQVREVLERFDLYRAVAPFRRCLRCNGLLEPVEKQAIAHRLQPRTRQHFDEFHRCPACDQLYWKGSHYEAMQRFIAKVLSTREGQERSSQDCGRFPDRAPDQLADEP